LYLLLWLTPVHGKLRDIASVELTGLLGAKVDIDRLRVVPFTRVELGGIRIISRGDTLLAAGELNAGLSGRNLLRGRIVVTDVELMAPDIRISRDSAGAPLNLQPILDRLKGDGSRPPTTFDLAVHTVVVRGGSARYDVNDAPRRQEGFDPNHIAVSDLNADLTAPKISSGRILVSLKRLTAREVSGLRLRRLSGDIDLAGDTLAIKSPGIRLDNTALHFADMTLNLKGREIGTVRILKGSAIYPGDLSAFCAALAKVPSPVMLDADITLLRDSLNIRKLNLRVPNNVLHLATRAQAGITGAGADKLDLGVNGSDLAETIGLFTPLGDGAATLLANLGKITFTGAAAWRKPSDVILNGILATDAGLVDIDASMARQRLRGVIDADKLDLARLLPGKHLGNADLAATFDVGKTDGLAALTIDRIGWKGHEYQNIDARLNFFGKACDATVAVDDSLARVTAGLTLDLTPGAYSATIDADIAALSPADFGFLEKYRGHMLSAKVNGAFDGVDLFRPDGQLTINALRFVNADGDGLIEAPVKLTSDMSSEIQTITLGSDLLDASVRGQINLRTLGGTFNNLLADALPQYFVHQPIDSLLANDFALTATIHEDAPLLDFAGVPAKLLYPVSVSGHVSQTEGEAYLFVSAPYIQKGNSLISHTALTGTLGKASAVSAHVTMPSKFGDMAVDLGARLQDGRGTAEMSFNNSDRKLYGGKIGLSFKPLREGVDINVSSSGLTLGNVGWNIEPAFIGVRNGSVIVNGLNIVRPGQELTIRGVASEFPEDRLVVKLDNINLDYIFQTLQLAETIQFGGDATGTVTASALMSREPILQTDDLFAKNFSYGHCVMGDANVRSRWNNETHGIEIHADVINRATDGSTVVDGTIYPLSSELDFTFKANHTPVGFLRTFMSTWASHVGGTASGQCHLYGNFKLVDLTGDFKAEDFALTVGFTDVTYHATDSVHIRPGVIDLKNITLRDATGRTGVINGQLTHEKFQDAHFRFRISDLDRMLVLDSRPTDDNDRWYGTVRANGSVEIKGVPGHVSIEADASTAPGSEFTFALTDAAKAAEYTFLTFRDVTPMSGRDSIPAAPGSPELDRLMKARVARAAQLAEASNFDFNLQVDVTPDARMNLIMDPTAGDRITGTGAGHIGVVYGSANDEMRLYGDYRIDKGEYNFSLQDIILKTFTIQDGSEVAFHGDPMDAQLNIAAVYQVNANLSDLDESFLNDKEVQRTNVPVYAVLNVNGQMQDPLITFDLDFPTLTSDVKRKVKSIVSTDDMMNRQIIYLLALNRFYTPEYMTATKGNDLMSVASGTLSSQLSNILGQLSDKISVAPSVRTESGDFSDVEFDVALSSTLLNNRLLLNGNFGYRDKALNNNQFIGDFDVEYLLTRRGNWRLKAYNHFNDRNLYVKTALTTQGIGLVFKHDFDSLFKPRR